MKLISFTGHRVLLRFLMAYSPYVRIGSAMAVGSPVLFRHTAPATGIVQGAQVKEGTPIGVTDYGSGTAKGRPHVHYQYLPQHAKPPAYVDPIAHHLAEANPYPAGTSCQPKSKSAK